MLVRGQGETSLCLAYKVCSHWLRAFHRSVCRTGFGGVGGGCRYEEGVRVSKAKEAGLWVDLCQWLVVVVE